MRKQLFLGSLFSVLVQLTVWAQTDTFYVQLGAVELEVGDLVEAKFILENVDAAIQVPNFDGLEVVSGPQQSSSFQFINGASTQSVSHTYYLKAMESGNFTIPPAFASGQDGETYQTVPLEMIVSPDSDGEVKKHLLEDEQMSSFWDRPSFDLNRPRIKKKKKLKTTKI